MKKLLSFTLLACGLLLMSHKAEAGIARSPKEVWVSSYTTGPMLVTPIVSTNAASASQYSPGAIYQLTLSSGAASEYVVLFDSTSCTNLTATTAQGNLPTTNYQYIGRFLFGSTTANTVITLDPPIRFDQGLCVIDSAVTGSVMITYELGRGLSGQ
jgi:hypothetical protein